MDMELNMSNFANILYQQDIDLGVNWSMNYEPEKALKQDINEPIKDVVQPSQNYIVDGETGEFLPVQAKENRVENTVIEQQTESEFDDFFSLLGDIDQNKNEFFEKHVDISELQSLIENEDQNKQQTTQSIFNEMVEMTSMDFNSDDGVPSSVPIPQDVDMQWQFDFPTPPSDHSPQQYVMEQPHQNINPNPTNESHMVMDFAFNENLPTIPYGDSPQGGATTTKRMPGEHFFNQNAEIRNVIDELQNLNNLDFLQENNVYNNPPNPPFAPPPLIPVDGAMESPTTNYEPITYNENIDNETGYPLSEQQSAADKERAKREKKESQRESRDLKKALKLKIPFSMEQIIHSGVEQYNEMLTQVTLNAEQQALVRDIRRRGKNKVAAQNCRKRKIETISSLERGVDFLYKKKDQLIAQKAELEMKQDKLKGNYDRLYKKIFQSLRDENGNSYDPRHFRLDQIDGAIILAPVLGLAQNKRNNDVKRGKKPITFFDLTKVKIEKPE